MSDKSGIKARVTDARRRWPLLDQLLRTVEHYGEVNGNLQAGAVTYFAFLSFFPLLALAFAVVGYLARFYPDAEQDLVTAIDKVLPGLVGNDDNQISLATIRDAAPGIASIGLLVMLYAGLGWLSSMRDALGVVFDLPEREKPNFVIGKLRDLLALITLGVVMLLSVAVSGVVTGLSKQILDWLEVDASVGWLLTGVALVVGFAAAVVLFAAMFRVLAAPEIPARSLWSGALLGALCFVLLTQVSKWLLQATAQSPAFQAFGIALVLVVWINYFSRVVMYAAAWSYVHPAARAARPDDATQVQGPQSPPIGARRRAAEAGTDEAPGWAAPFAAGGATALALVALVRRFTRSRP